MLGALSLSGITGASSSFSQSVDLELIDQIVERSPRNATSFPLVYRAYGEVLEENGLSPSTDAAYYQFLLKLGVIRAPTWGERWDIWRAANESRITLDKSKISGPNHTLDDVRARVPFLASASSDLDEGFEAESYGDADSLLLETRPSPRKHIAQEQEASRSRSLVGYIPSESLEYGLGSFNPPFRTSTPVYAQDVRHSPATPPPYSVSDISETRYSNGLAYGSDSGTPKADLKDWMDEDVLDLEQAELERKADQFFETGLMGRCWDVWVQSNKWVKSTTQRIDQVRDTILLRQTLLKWKNIYEQHLKLPNTAQSHYEHHRKAQALDTWIERYKTVNLEELFQTEAERRKVSQSWKRWRMELGKRRTERWERDMRSREKNFMTQRTESLQQAVLEKWRDALRCRTADVYYQENAQRLVFNIWRDETDRSQHLKQDCDSLIRKQDTKLVRTTFVTWRKMVKLRPSEEAVVQGEEDRLIRRIWDHWRVLTSHHQAGKTFSERRLQVGALKRWIGRAEDIKSMTLDALRVSTVRDTTLLRGTFDTWAMKERGLLLAGVSDKRILKKAVMTWLNRQAQIRTLEDNATTFILHSQSSTVAQALSHWQTQTARQTSLRLQADLIYQHRIKSAILSKWTQARQKIESNLVNADTARAFFLQREALACWKGSLIRRKQDGLVERRRLADLKEGFDRWRAVALQKKEDERGIELFQAGRDRRLATAAIARWTVQVVNIKSRELDVVEQRDFSLQKHALSRWNRTMSKHRDAIALLQSVIDVKTEDRLRMVFTAWSAFAKVCRERRLMLERVKREKKGRLLLEVFSVWVERKRDKQLQAVEEEVSFRHEDVILFGVFDKWKARSKRLPAVSFENHRIKRMALDRWKAALPRALELKKAGRDEERRLLGEVFAVWKEAARSKVKARASRQRGRIRPSLGHDSLPQPFRATRPLSYQPFPLRNPLADSEPRPSPRNSLSNEPAYSRLRSELGRRRGGSDEPEVSGRRVSGSDVMIALKGSLTGR